MRLDQHCLSGSIPLQSLVPGPAPGSPDPARPPEIGWLSITAAHNRLVPRRRRSPTIRLWAENLSARQLATGLRSCTLSGPAPVGAGSSVPPRTRLVIPSPRSQPRASSRQSSIPSRLLASLCRRSVFWSHIHLLALLERIGGIDYHPVGDVHASDNFQTRTVVTANRNRAQLHLAVTADHRNLCTLGAKQHRVHRKSDLAYADAHTKMHLAEGPRQQLAFLVGHVDFGQQCARRGIDCLRRSYHFPGEFLAGILLQRDHGFTTALDRRCITLRNADIHASRIYPRAVEQLFSCRASSSVDQRSWINIAFREHSREGHVD